MKFLFDSDFKELLRSVHADREKGADFFELNSILRSRGVPAEKVAPLLLQTQLQEIAQKKFGNSAKDYLYTRNGLEQASRSEVAALTAKRYKKAGIEIVTDLGCGIGAQSIAFLNAGLNVRAVEIDPDTAEICATNLATLTSSRFKVYNEDATTHEIPTESAVFLDPARRKGATRVYNPHHFSPSIDFCFSTAKKHPTAIKLGPAFPHAEIPAGVTAEWVSHNGEVLENLLWFGGLSTPNVTRRATVITSNRGGTKVHEIASATPTKDARVINAGNAATKEYIYEPDGAVIRAELLGFLVSSLEAHLLAKDIAYFTSDQKFDTPFAKGFKVIDILPFKTDLIAREMRAREIGKLEIKKRGADIDPAIFRKKLRLRGKNEAVLIITRSGEKRVAFLCERI